METITLKEIVSRFPFKGIRSLKSWCQRNAIDVYNFDRIEFLLEKEFILVFEKPFIDKLKRKFGDSWGSVYEVYKSGNIQELETLNESITKNQFYPKYKSENKNINKYKNELFKTS